MKRILTILFLVAGVLAGAAQKLPTTAKPQPRTAERSTKQETARKKKSQQLPDEGTLAGDVYTEKFFNLRYDLSQGWVVKTADMRQGLSESDSAVLLLSAFGKAAPSAAEVNPSVTITAESLALYPDVKTPEDYFDSLSQLVESKGFKVLNPPAELDLAGVTFLRGDFQKQEGDVTTYQATMVAFRKGYVLEITAISGDDEDLTPLLNRLHIFAPPTMRRTP